jgi:hypothetical protein
VLRGAGLRCTERANDAIQQIFPFLYPKLCRELSREGYKEARKLTKLDSGPGKLEESLTTKDGVVVATAQACGDARKLTRDVVLALSPQHLECGHCISNGESFVAGDLAIERSARANRLFRRNHASFQVPRRLAS